MNKRRSKKPVIERLFTTTHCERCGGLLQQRALSMLADEVICFSCKEAEKQTPEYSLQTRQWLRDLSKTYQDIPKRGSIKKNERPR